MRRMTTIVITPTRGRPYKAKESYAAFLDTRRDPTSKMVFVVDKDDESWDEYVKTEVPLVTYDHEGGGMAPPMNAAALDYRDKFDVIGFIGDDHRFRTHGWDIEINRTLRIGGLAYGNDLARQDIPTAVFISSNIVKAIGWFCLPGAKHLYLDNTWAQLGSQAGCLHYLPEVIIEHVHAFYGKAEMDEGYERVNAPAVYEHDEAVYRQWNMSGQSEKDVEAVKEVLREAGA